MVDWTGVALNPLEIFDDDNDGFCSSLFSLFQKSEFSVPNETCLKNDVY